MKLWIFVVLFAALLQKLFGESDLVVSMYQDAAV